MPTIYERISRILTKPFTDGDMKQEATSDKPLLGSWLGPSGTKTPGGPLITNPKLRRWRSDYGQVEPPPTNLPMILLRKSGA
jgi:hypothetical protein